MVIARNQVTKQSETLENEIASSLALGFGILRRSTAYFPVGILVMTAENNNTED